MDTLSLINNFSSFLQNSLPYLSVAMIEIGDDGWDEFTESCFNAMVIDRLNEKSGTEIEFTYGEWRVVKDKEVFLKVCGGANFLVGEYTETDGMETIDYSEQENNSETLFAMRELSHPFEEGRFDHAEGIITSGDSRILGRRICVKLELCKSP